MMESARFDWGGLRAGLILAGFAALTLPLMPVQALLLRVAPRAARALPHWYHRQVCRLIGLRLHVEGALAPDKPVLVVANHTSWLDIPVLSAVAPVSFIAKREVGGWPVVGSLARLQRCIFVDRTRRQSVGGTTSEVGGRLTGTERVVLFAEGTSSDGNQVLPLRSSLFGALDIGGDRTPCVQTVAIVYARRNGLPLARADRGRLGWYGDMDLGPHAWALLRGGPLDIVIRIGAPLPQAAAADRKALTRLAEHQLRQDVVELLRGHAGDTRLPVASPAPSQLRRTAVGATVSAKWS
jgi:lyso-ornithine lipid O-acyltransferase